MKLASALEDWRKGNRSEALKLTVAENGEQVQLAGFADQQVFELEVIPNPLLASMGNPENLNQLIQNDPESGNEALDRTSERILQKIEASKSDGIFYCLEGARPSVCTPMEFGGRFLERDREILKVAQDKFPTFLWVMGSETLYLDFVSDLPFDALGWDVQHSGFSTKQLLELRETLTFSTEDSGDFSIEGADRLTSKPNSFSMVAL